MKRRGKYGVRLANGIEIIETKLEIALAKAQARKSQPIAIAYLCARDCQGHGIGSEGRRAVAEVFPDFDNHVPDDV